MSDCALMPNKHSKGGTKIRNSRDNLDPMFIDVELDFRDRHRRIHLLVSATGTSRLHGGRFPWL
jgi:hypothetical protein